MAVTDKLPREGGIIEQKLEAIWKEQFPELLDLPMTVQGMQDRLSEQENRLTQIESLEIVDRNYVEDRILATEKVLNKQEILGMDFVDKPFMIYYDEGIKRFVKGESNNIWFHMNNNMPSKLYVDNMFSDILDSSSQGNKPLRDYIEDRPTFNAVGNMGFVTGNWVESNFVGETEFATFLSGHLTPEFIDNLVGTLMDVDVSGIRIDLSTALENLNFAIDQRPTKQHIINGMDFYNLRGSKQKMANWLEAVSKNADFRDNIKKCFGKPTTGSSAMRDLVFSLKTDGDGLKGSLSLTKANMDNLREDFARFNTNMHTLLENGKANLTNSKAGLQTVLGKISAPYLSSSTAKELVNVLKGLVDNVKQTFEDIRAERGAFSGGEGDYNGAIYQFMLMRDNFDTSYLAVHNITSKANGLKTCGTANLGW